MKRDRGRGVGGWREMESEGGRWVLAEVGRVFYVLGAGGLVRGVSVLAMRIVGRGQVSKRVWGNEKRGSCLFALWGAGEMWRCTCLMTRREGVFRHGRCRVAVDGQRWAAG